MAFDQRNKFIVTTVFRIARESRIESIIKVPASLRRGRHIAYPRRSFIQAHANRSSGGTYRVGTYPVHVPDDWLNTVDHAHGMVSRSVKPAFSAARREERSPLMQ